MNFLNKVDLSSYPAIIVATTVLWLLVTFVGLVATAVLTAINLPVLYDHHFAVLQLQTLIVSTFSLPVFFMLFAITRKKELLSRQLNEVVRTDGLTGLLSREAFLDDFKAENSDRKGEVRDAFLIVDADFFKAINDTHGHIAGDKALVAITEALQRGIRSSDKIGRLGGEEFAIHLRDVTKERAKQIAERLRLNVIDASTEAGIPDLRLSVSIGGVFYKTHHDVVSLLIAADKQLYRAKNNGRNRVEFEIRDQLPVAA